ncbi:TetR/AcrR family transcriptional regulator [Tamlana sp. s12]|uniref:TetR/AcrR family transcriptional regulator n=1 Tax=Tamlana sp. s12 TaxID=1630406 RepID=UPI0008001720|nr:TetR/AcrR family transcriptional regulator [Tamlana sp. s12]OBQ52795.1 TetR family transcriptional regulator [Tamlana sp. s12]QQY81184.1 TetR/AcrR family transcriptional regulator [Tamlana sp. s12]
MQQELKSELTKQHIVHEAFKLFYENGYKATSINDVMKATKMTKGAFYHHYKNKQQLVLEVIQLKIQKRVHDGMITPLLEPGHAIDILKDTFLNRIRSFPLYDKQNGCPMNNFINEIDHGEVGYQLALKSIIDKWKYALVTLIEKGKSEGTIKNDTPSESVAVYLISAFEGIRGIRKIYEDDVILDQYISGLELYINQLKS